MATCYRNVTSLLPMLLVIMVAEAVLRVHISYSCYWWLLSQKLCFMFIQVAHANGYMLQKCYKFTAHATDDYCWRSCVTTLYKLLMLMATCYRNVTSLLPMLLVIMVSEAGLRVHTSCSGYWWLLSRVWYKLLMLLLVLSQKLCFMFIQVAHANGYMLQKCYKFTAHATGDNGRRSCVTSSYK